MRGAIITGDHNWVSLSGKRIHNDNVLIRDIFDGRIYHKSEIRGQSDMVQKHDFFRPRPIVLSKNVFITKCNINFAWYWISNHEKVFPCLENLFLNGNPTDLVGVLKDAPFLTYVAERHYDLCDRWSHNISRYRNIIDIKDRWFEEIESEWVEERIVVSKV